MAPIATAEEFGNSRRFRMKIVHWTETGSDPVDHRVAHVLSMTSAPLVVRNSARAGAATK